MQASGEAEYVNDIPIFPNEVHGAFIVSTQVTELSIVFMLNYCTMSMHSVICLSVCLSV